MLRASLVSHTHMILAATVVAQGVALLISVMVSRTLGQGQLGALAFLLTSMSFIALLVNGGTSSVVIRYISKARDETARFSIKQANTIISCNSIITLTALLCIFHAGSVFIPPAIDSLDFTIYALSGVLLGIDFYLKSVLIAASRIVLHSTAVVLGALVQIMLAFVWYRDYGITGIAVSTFVSTAVSVMICFLGSYKLVERFRRLPLKKAYLDGQIVRDFFPSFVSSFAITPFLWLSQQILMRADDGLVQLGAIAMALQWFNFLQFIPIAIAKARTGEFVSLVNREERNSAATLFYAVTASSIVTTIILAAMVLLFSEVLLGIYKIDYEHAQVLYIMCVAAVVLGAQQNVGLVISAYAKYGYGLGVNALWSVTYMSAFILLKDYGATGMALAYLAAYGVAFVMSYRLVFGLLDVPRLWNR